MATLHIVAGNERGKSFPIAGNELKVGRGTDQDVVLTDVASSRRHFSIVKDGARFKLTDHGSGNGTIVNGAKVANTILKDGDMIEIGQTQLKFEDQPAKTAAPAPAPKIATSQARPPAAGATPASGALAPPPQSGGMGAGAKVAIYGMMFILCAGGIGIILTRTVFAKTVVIPSDADLVYKQGLRLFASGEYESAKTSFTDALKQAPDSAEAKRYLALCDTEAKNRDALKTGERALNQRKYPDAIKSLDAIEATSVHYDMAQQLRREATSHQNDNTVAAAPPTPAAPPVVAAAPTAPEKGTPTKPEKVAPEKPSKPTKVADNSKSNKDDTHLKPAAVAKPQPVAVAATPPPEKISGSGSLDSKEALGLYKSRDFEGARKVVLKEAAASSKDFMRLITVGKQIGSLKELIDAASADEKSSPDKAAKEYEDAIALDQKISRGVHGAYLRNKSAGIMLQAAKQQFSNQKFEASYSLAIQAQKAGSSDAPALLKQLDQKAGELITKAQGQQKGNPEEAKKLGRQVMKMVPSGTPNYVKAYQIVNSSGAARRDEDE